MKQKFKKFFFIFFLFLLTILIIIPKESLADSVTVSSDKTQSSDTSVQQNIDTADVTLTVSGNAQVDDDAKAVAVDAALSGVAVIVESGSTITTTNLDNGIYAENTTLLDVTNSGTISANRHKAIDIYRSTNSSITNNSGATISAVGNTIRTGGTGGDNSSGYTITNYGKMFTTSTGTKSSVLFSNENSSGGTIINNSGGEIYSGGNVATIRVGGTTTITNRGSIKNNTSVDDNVIELLGSDNTVTLEKNSIIVGKISSASGTSGNTLKLNLGTGQSYFYETEGDFTLQDLDGNHVVKGSAGSVGQGGNENIDELLGYKSLNIRKSLNKFVKSEGFKNKKTEWQGIQATSIERKENKNNLALGYEFYSLGVNIIRPLENENVIASFEYSEQDFQKDHTIKRYNFLFGLHYNESEINKFNNNSFILAGATLNESERKIITNTTSSGTLNISDAYESFEIYAGKKFKNKKLIPNVGTNLSYSYTPAHSESKYYSWEKKHVTNISVDLNDEFTIVSEKNNSKLGIGWILDYRTLISDSGTKYSVNGTKATYKQHNDLKKEMTISANINYEKKIHKSGKIIMSIDGTRTSQEVDAVSANISFVFWL